jgi:hypothetical protein
MLRADGEDGAAAGTGKAALGGPEVRTAPGQPARRSAWTGYSPRRVELGRCPQYHPADTPSSPANLCTSITFAALRSVVDRNRYCMPKHAAPWGGPVVALPAAVHHRTRRGIPNTDGCSAASAGRQGQLYADAPLDRTAMRSGAQSLTDTARQSTEPGRRTRSQTAFRGSLRPAYFAANTEREDRLEPGGGDHHTEQNAPRMAHAK